MLIFGICTCFFKVLAFLCAIFGIFAGFCTILSFFLHIMLCAKFLDSMFCLCYFVGFFHLCGPGHFTGFVRFILLVVNQVISLVVDRFISLFVVWFI